MPFAGALSRLLSTVFLMVVLIATASRAAGTDYWVSPGDPTVVTNNDCGFISAVAGTPLIRRSFHGPDHPGVPVHAADRISSGDELIVPVDARLELTSGSNIIMVAGAGSRVRLGGLRQFPDPAGRPMTRLDILLLAAEVRVQVRLNEERPEAVMAALNGADMLVTRGDVEMFSDSVWRGAVIAGGAQARVRRGNVSGAPFSVDAGQSVGASGEKAVAAAAIADIRKRLPFSFELATAALPPLPPMSTILEAP